MKKKDGLMDKILVFITVLLIVFSISMIILYILTGGIPDTLVTCVFSVCGGECGIMGWIKTTKDKIQTAAEEQDAIEAQEGLEDAG